MNKTADIEFALDLIIERYGPLTLAVMEERLYEEYPQLLGEDRRWIGVAISHLGRDGKIRWVGCDRDHSHEGDCVVEVTRS